VEIVPGGDETKTVVGDVFENVMNRSRTNEEILAGLERQRVDDKNLQAGMTAGEEEAIATKRLDPARFNFKGVPPHTRLQTTDGIADGAPLLVQLHWPPLHNDDVVLTP